MAWEVFSIYHKNQPEWRTLLTKVCMNRQDLDLWVRDPCVNDPKTAEYLQSAFRAPPAYAARIGRGSTTSRMNLDRAIRFVRTIFATRNSVQTSSRTTFAQCTACLGMLEGNGALK